MRRQPPEGYDFVVMQHLVQQWCQGRILTTMVEFERLEPHVKTESYAWSPLE
jgi:hypothetical protein